MKIGTLSPKGNGTPARYNLQDLQANKTGIRLYRLKMIDRDGSVNYSAIRSLKFSEMKFGLVNIFPNPAGNTINISVNTEAREKIILTITNLQGQEVLQKTLVANKGINNFAEDVRHLAQATYIATIKNIKTGKESHQNFQKL